MKKWWGQRRSAARRSDAPRRVGDAASTRAASEQGAGHYVRSRTISSYAPLAGEMSRLFAHELRHHRRHLIRTLVLCSIVVIVLGIVVCQMTANVGRYSYSPAVISNPDTVELDAAINDYYATRPLERLRFLLDKQALGQFLASKVPEVVGVQSVSFAGIGSSQVALTMRTPVASWKVNAQTLFVDQSGVSFTHSYYGTPAVEVDDQSGAAVSGSSAIASSSMIRYIGQLIAALEANGTGKVTRITLPAGMIRELDVYLEGRAYRVKVQLDRDVPSQASDVKTALTYIDAHGGAKEYVDARVAGKAFYK